MPSRRLLPVVVLAACLAGCGGEAPPPADQTLDEETASPTAEVLPEATEPTIAPPPEEQETPVQVELAAPTVPLPGAPETANWTVTIGDPDGAARPLLGVNLGPLPAVPNYADLTDAYRAIGVSAIRTHDYYGPLDMAAMYPDQEADPTDPGSYDFESSDRVYAAIVGRGFEPYLRIGDSWEEDPDFRCQPTNLDNWVQAAVEVVAHYTDPTLWEGSHIHYVEIWNEPDSEQFWEGSPLQFYELYVETAVALKTAYPDLMVGGPGLAPAAYLSPQGRAFTTGFLDYVVEQGAPLDFFSWHMYHNDPQVFGDAAAYYRQQLDSRGLTATESHISEWNSVIHGAEITPSEALELRTGARGAAILTAAWIGMQEQGVDASLFYRGTDPIPELPTFYGLFYTDGRPKRIALAFKLWSQVSAYPERLDTDAGGSNLWVLAGRNAQDEIAVLVANPSADGTSWQVAFADGRDPIDGTLTLEVVNDDSDVILSYSLTAPVVPIGPHTVQLLTLSP